MKKVLVALLIIALIPYLFLATSVTNGSEDTEKGYNCTVTSIQRYKKSVSLASVYYGGFNMLSNKYIILPQFFLDEEAFTADCGNGINLEVGYSDFAKVGTQLHMYTRLNEVRIFGIKLFEERGVFMYGTDWGKGEKQGEFKIERLKK